MPGPAVAIHQVFTLGFGVVIQPQLPQRQLEMRLLGVVRVEADCHQDVVVALGRALGEVQDVVVPAVEERHAQVGLQGAVLPADAVELGDLGNDVAGLAEIAWANFVLLRVQVLLLARQRCAFAQFEARVHAPQPRTHGGQRRADEEAGTAGGVQEVRVDVGRVDEEVGPVALAPWRLVELLEVLAQFLFVVAPGEVGIALRVPDLAQAGHHRRLGEGFGEEDDLGVPAAHIGDQPLPERQWLGVRVVDAEGFHPLFDPADHHVTQGQPQRRHGLGCIEIDVDDVLVLLRWVLGIANGAVRSPAEPARVLLEPGVVLGALDGEVEGDFQAMLGRRGHQAAEVVAAAQLRVNCLVAAFRAADGIRAARVAGLRREGIVAALAVLHADRMDGREVQHVEAHVADHRQALVHIIEGAVALGAVGDRAREQLVPTGELRGRAVDIDGEFTAAGQVAAVLGIAHQAGGGGVEKQRHLVVGIQRGQALLQGLELLAQGTVAQLDALAQHQSAFFQLQPDLDTSVVLLLQVVAIGGERVDPGLDTEQVRAQFGGGELGQP
ncbi:hypothetical protein D3C72_934220 [compost metagenome]